MISYPDTFVRPDQVGGWIPPYAPTYRFPGEFIDAAHAALARGPLKDGMLIQLRKHGWWGSMIPGWLRREDALKLYELAYFADAPMLELGSYNGLSTSILSRANLKSPNPQNIMTVDLDPACTRATWHTLKSLRLHHHVIATSADATELVRQAAAAGRQYGFVFIDHSHAYGPVHAVCQTLTEITLPGGFCLFHDFNDARNCDPNNQDYGVYQAVQAGLDLNRFEFYGIFGCTGLYRARR